MEHPPSDPIRLTVVFVQYDRKKYSRALDRMIAFLTGFEADYRIVIVDNAHPGTWMHQVCANIVQVGGDNSAWEFSAFDHGLDFLADSGRVSDVYGFATDAFLADGDEYLDLIDDDCLRYCLDLEACVGWIDSFGEDHTAFGLRYRDWMRTSLFFVPRKVLAGRLPMTTPFDPASIFGADSAAPFLESAPLSGGFRNCLLSWLTTEETGCLPSRGLALPDPSQRRLLRVLPIESVRHPEGASALRPAAPGSRALLRFPPDREVGCESHRLRRIPEVNKEQWQWFRGVEAEIPEPQFRLESYEAPRTMIHGQSEPLQLVGWVATRPQVKEVFVRLSDGDLVGARCDQPRPDVLALHSEFNDELCGFELTADLGVLAPGSYDVEWFVLEPSLASDLGCIEVLPCFEFRARRCLIPSSAYPGQDLPISLEGTLQCSSPLEEVAVLWNGEPTGITPSISERQRRANGICCYDVMLLGTVCFRDLALQHRLELELYVDGASRSWKHYARIDVEEVLPPFAVDPGDRRAQPPDRPGAGALQGGRMVGRPARPAGVPARGAAALRRVIGSLGAAFRRRVVRDPARGRRVDGWGLGSQPRPQVGRGSGGGLRHLAAPAGHGEGAQHPRRVPGSRLPEGRESPHILGVVGWVQHHFLVDYLLLKIDGEDVARLPIDELREDVSDHCGETLVQRQGFHADIEFDIVAGEHNVELVAVQGSRQLGEWRDSLVLRKKSGAVSFRLKSSDL